KTLLRFRFPPGQPNGDSMEHVVTLYEAGWLWKSSGDGNRRDDRQGFSQWQQCSHPAHSVHFIRDPWWHWMHSILSLESATAGTSLPSVIRRIIICCRFSCWVAMHCGLHNRRGAMGSLFIKNLQGLPGASGALKPPSFIAFI